ncbi:hypothetical protein DFA_00951 [Cavenderia fasciculata]|uniref:Uncharacterized protein n=1 Tax=Cavenderia fasciculata TaxID=261658 RepID=F4PUQ7_CACFS|nr:uncharacterized protein DFA_00951 [Cavenderia fasciculata]EGG21076.1 hypothetical protein DFA_00951 [Cavenderia fasciculata]|eukprot:XP_004358926.1 hypothetical protein DFA_00951 [Cavenderia fasciculata]
MMIFTYIYLSEEMESIKFQKRKELGVVIIPMKHIVSCLVSKKAPVITSLSFNNNIVGNQNNNSNDNNNIEENKNGNNNDDQNNNNTTTTTTSTINNNNDTKDTKDKEQH